MRLLHGEQIGSIREIRVQNALLFAPALLSPPQRLMTRSPPKVVDRQSRQHEPQSKSTVYRFMHDLIENDGRRGDHEDRREQRISPHSIWRRGPAAPAQHEKRA